MQRIVPGVASLEQHFQTLLTDTEQSRPAQCGHRGRGGCWVQLWRGAADNSTMHTHSKLRPLAGAAPESDCNDPAQLLLELGAIFENAAVGIFIARNSVIRRCNVRAAEIFGYADPAALIGQPTALLYPDAASFQQMGHEAGPVLAAGRPFCTEWRFVKCDGAEVWCTIDGRPLYPQRPAAGTAWVVQDITEARRAEYALRDSKAVLDDTLAYMDQGILLVDNDLKVLATNRRFFELLDFPTSLNVPGTHFSEFIRYNAERCDYGPGDVEEQVSSRIASAARLEPHHFEHRRPDGTVIELRGVPVPGRGFARLYTDITKRAKAEQALRESEARFRSLTELSSDWFWEQDSGFRYSRLEGRHVSGDAAGFEAELGKTPWELGFEIEGGWELHRSLLDSQRPFRDLVMQRRGGDGQVHYLRVSGEPMLDAQGRLGGYRGVGRDVTQQKEAEERIQYLATHDGLTGLPNRTMFSRIVNRKLHSARRYEGRFAVMFIDLDRFKLINDTLGHEAGDILLKEIAERFGLCLRACDVVARLGGDEFVVMVEDLGEPEQPAALARKLLAAAMRPVSIHGQECRVTASVGICCFPQDAQDEESLMKNADIAMYCAKQRGKNNFQFYSKEAGAQSLERQCFEASLRRALERDEFSLHYQAKLDLASGAIAGVEALLRWQHPDLGLVPPLQFIPLAEETGLIVAIGQWVLRTVCAQNMAWQRHGLPPVCVAVNISARQFNDELADDIQTALQASGMPAALLELELNEGTVMGNPERALRLLSVIKAMGVRIAIDDFGSGYSSLAQIKRFPIDTLKVDRSFIREIGSGDDGSVTQAIIAMGKTLSLTVVAGGVETQAQQTFLSAHACDQLQGYHFSKPVLPEQFAQLLREHVALRPSQ
jgi:diguanylate cyclase (GGDEF)-like protein/PAS domain S-box-containing protein